MKIQKLSSDIAGFAKDAINQVGETLEHGRDVVGDSIEQGVDVSSKRLETLGNLLGAYMSLKTIASAINGGPMRTLLGALGLQRRRSVLSTVMRTSGLVLAGAAVGAGVAMLVAPQSGSATREAILRRVRTLRGQPISVATGSNGPVRDVGATVHVVNVARSNTTV